MRSWKLLAAVITFVVVLDQLTKALIPILPTSEFIHPEGNPSFTMGVASASQLVTVALAAAILVSFGCAAAMLARRGWMPTWVPGLLIGGAVSNLADRVFLNGTVRDFLAVPRVLVFNLADVAVDLGIVAFVAFAILHMRRADS